MIRYQQLLALQSNAPPQCYLGSGAQETMQTSAEPFL